jgi:ubiquinone biosynthesis protein
MSEGRAARTVGRVSRLVADEALRSARARLAHGAAADQLLRQQRAQGIRQTLEQLGPLYVKVGQILATRPDMVPQYIIDELQGLNDWANVESLETFEPVLRGDLGPDWRTRFRHIDLDQPLGAASLAQVYKAVWSNGRPCVIKVQRPGSRPAVLGDMAVLRRVAWMISRVAPRFSEVVDVQAMLEVLFAAMEDELDFTREARNMKRGRKAAREFKRLRVPKVLEATPRVLIQTFAEGVPINQVKEDDLSPRRRKQIAQQLMEFMLHGYFVKRTFHADPHPGNIIVSPDGKAHIIDWGMVGKLDRGVSSAALSVLLALARADGATLARSWVRLGTTTPWSNVSALIGDVSRVVPRWSDATLAELNYGVALMSMLRFSTKRGVQVTPMISILGKSLANMEGSVRCIYPKLKISTAVRDTLQGAMRGLVLDTIGPEQGSQTLLEVLNTLAHSPSQLQASLQDMADHNLGVQTRTNLGDPIRAGVRHRILAREGLLASATVAVAVGLAVRQTRKDR